MQYGHFDQNNREYVIDRIDLPASWTNYLGVRDMCAVLNHTAGGYIFYKSPEYHRITRFRPNGVPEDRPGHYVYIRDDEDGDYWSISWQPVGKSLDEAVYQCRHGLSYSVYESEYRRIKASQKMSVAMEDPVEIWDIRIRNTDDRKRRLSVFSYLEFSFHQIQMDNQNFQMKRAVIGDEFTRANIQLLGKALAMKMQDEDVADQGICIGYDRRFLSKEAVMWACEVLAAEGIKCRFINRSSPTPLIMYYVMANDLPYGMMVTASHNPAIYNGFKVFTRGGRDADEFQTKELERYIAIADEQKENGNPPAVIPYEQARSMGLVVEFNPLNEYIDAIISGIDMKRIRDRGLRIALDPMYGVSQTSLKTILSIARCEVEIIHDRHDTLFGGKLPAPNAATLRALQNYVADRGCDIGIATDGDADRIGVIDDTGAFLHPNDILVLLYYYLRKYKGWTGPCVRNVATTHMLDRVAESFGEKCYEVPVGFKYISSRMQETNALIGGESSGGLTVRGHINGKDGIYAAALLVEMIAVTGKKLSEIIRDIRQEYGTITMEEHDYSFSPEKKQEINVTYNKGQYYMAKQFGKRKEISDSIFMIKSNPTVLKITNYNTPAGGSYRHLETFWENDFDGVMNLAETLDTSIGLFYNEGRLYLVRNLLDTAFEPWGILVHRLNTGYCLEPILKSYSGMAVRIAIDGQIVVCQGDGKSWDDLPEFQISEDAAYLMKDNAAYIYQSVKGSDFCLSTILRADSLDLYTSFYGYRTIVLIMAAFLIPMICLFAVLSRRYLVHPVKIMVDHAREIENGNLGCQDHGSSVPHQSAFYE